jgi:hypothetical protein
MVADSTEMPRLEPTTGLYRYTTPGGALESTFDPRTAEVHVKRGDAQAGIRLAPKSGGPFAWRSALGRGPSLIYASGKGEA